MTWQLKETNYRVFGRNTLISTDIEVRFFPIFRIGEQSGLSAYQDSIRGLFPGYKERKIRGVSILDEGVEFQDQIQYEFISSQPERISLILDKQTLRVSCSNHNTRKEIIKSFQFAFDALLKCFGDVVPTRLGVRYVNIVDKQRVETDLGENVSWSDLVSDAYFHHPHEIVDAQETNFSTEIRSNVVTGGHITLRYGLTQGDQNVPDHFRFDIDRFVGEEDKLGGNTDQLAAMIEMFVGDIYSLFTTVRGKRLEEWMETE